jgi:hypothetical protein
MDVATQRSYAVKSGTRSNPGNVRVSSVREEAKPFSVKRAALAATIGNMLEFYEALPQNIGCGVFATVYAVAMASFGGTAQLVVTWLHDVTGNPLAPKRM